MNNIVGKGYGPVEYRMSPVLAKELLKNRKGADVKMRTQDYLCKYVNEECGLKGQCVVVTTTL